MSGGVGAVIASAEQSAQHPTDDRKDPTIATLVVRAHRGRFAVIEHAPLR
jgi:hypothetical protein